MTELDGLQFCADMQAALELARIEAQIATLTRQADNLRGSIDFYESRGEHDEVVRPAKAVRGRVSG
jgi:hypothetical protein